MRSARTLRAPTLFVTLFVLLALLVPVALTAAPVRDGDSTPDPRAVSASSSGSHPAPAADRWAAGGLDLVWDALMRLFGGGDDDDGDHTPGSGIDPDGSRRR
jgi:hypothetical protein